MRYKVPRKEGQVPSASLVSAALVQEAVAHLLTGPALMLLIVGPVFRWLSPDAVSPEAVPTFRACVLQMAVFYVVNEIGFYWGHRALHWGPLYRAIHKQHHAFVGTRSFAAEYSHVVEAVFTAYLPFLAGPLLMRAHFHSVSVWFFARLVETYEAHSGYVFVGSIADRLGLSYAKQAAYHDHHHVANRGNFGNPLLDWLCGTMDHWIAIGRLEGYISRAHETVRKDKNM